MPPEPWLRGPIAGIDPWLLPAAHAFVQAGEELARAADGLSLEQLWARPGSAASVAFHIRHTAGATDRLLSYARGEALSEAQKQAAAAEAQDLPRFEAAPLLAELTAAFERARVQLLTTPRERLLEPRGVGRAQLPSNVLGLLFHAAEHAQRHAGQAVTTAKILRGL
jgi:uncharacterized damage-inducible protein DinB